MSPEFRTATLATASARADSRPVPERLLAAAMELVRTEGLRGLSQARVAAAAGLRQSHLTYYFPTRKDLIKALVKAIHAEISEAMGAAPEGDGAAASVDKARAFFVRRLREPLMARLMLALLNAADEDPSLRQWLRDFDRDVVDHLREIFTRLGLRPSENELALFHASFIGAAILSLRAGTEAGADRTALLAGLAFDRLVHSASRPAGRKARTRHPESTP
ncbi:MAG: TetR/AcrR family transcriptional regulator [Desulfobacteraceae bacterium]|nr:TetR/AcrR family transcriptional regulator [Desulfobacteraceae bacterium]